MKRSRCSRDRDLRPVPAEARSEEYQDQVNAGGAESEAAAAPAGVADGNVTLNTVPVSPVRSIETLPP